MALRQQTIHCMSEILMVAMRKTQGHIVLKPPPLMVVTFGKSQYPGGYNISCKGYNDGSAWVQTITGGRGTILTDGIHLMGIFRVQLIPIGLMNITAGKYYLEIKDTLSCVKIDSVLIIRTGWNTIIKLSIIKKS